MHTVLRHSAAMQLLQKRVDRTVIALWPGHESVETTQMYIHADIQLKEKAMARTKPVTASPGRYRPGDNLLTFLEALCLCRHSAPVRPGTSADMASAQHNPEGGKMHKQSAKSLDPVCTKSGVGHTLGPKPRKLRAIATYESKLTNLCEAEKIGQDGFGASVLVRAVGVQPVATASRFQIDQRQRQIIAAKKPGEGARRIAPPFGIAIRAQSRKAG